MAYGATADVTNDDDTAPPAESSPYATPLKLLLACAAAIFARRRVRPSVATTGEHR